ncbi:MAG: mannose-6-phosphate isomerase, class I [Lacisediminihabitans sp.]
MFVRVTNTPRPYAWGSTTAIADLLGHTASGQPEAELWLGAHSGSPSVIVDPDSVGGWSTLPEWIAASPELTLGRIASTGRLPFLLKILAASHPLSLQAHPTPEQAVAGFARENALGIPLDAAQRNYKDAFAKPELIYALSDTFEALCGFRPLEEVRALILDLLDLDARTEDPQPQPLEDLLAQLSDDVDGDGSGFSSGSGAGSGSGTGSGSGSGVGSGAGAGAGAEQLRSVFEWLISSGPGVPTLVALVTRLAPLSSDASLTTAALLASEYPDDPGIVISLLLNRVTLARGEALYLAAGNIHAYLDGLGVELMSASDNVLRGGLTPKHIDVPELLGVLDFTPVAVPYLSASVPSAGVEVFRPGVPDFVLVRVSGALGAGVGAGSGSGSTSGSTSGSRSGSGSDAGSGSASTASVGPAHVMADAVLAKGAFAATGQAETGPVEAVFAEYELSGPGIAICTAGEIRIGGGVSSVALRRGEAVYITPDEASLVFTGGGELFLATTGE